MDRHIDDLGRIVIPKEMRDSLNIRPGDIITMQIDDDKLILTKKGLSKSERALKYIRDTKDVDIEELIRILQSSSNSHTISSTYTDIDIGMRLRDERLKNRYTLEQLAKELNTTVEVIQAWEDSFSLPADNFVKKLSKLYNVSEKYLLGLED